MPFPSWVLLSQLAGWPGPVSGHAPISLLGPPRVPRVDKTKLEVKTLILHWVPRWDLQ